LGNLILGYETSPENHFALRVVGNSMIEAGILEGDHVIVQKDASIRSGDIVVAVLQGEVTVKRFQKKKGKVFLVPENKTMSPIEVQTDEFYIQGKVVSLQRKF
jgi:repressor LexA